MTNGWVDIKNADVILAMGGNPAENHPVGFKWFMEARRTRNAKLIVVDPRFTRTAAVADLYAPLRPGTDIAFLLGIIRYTIEKKRYHEDYVKLHTNASYVIGEKYSFHDGLFAGFDPAKAEYAKDAFTPREHFARGCSCSETRHTHLSLSDHGLDRIVGIA